MFYFVIWIVLGSILAFDFDLLTSISSNPSNPLWRDLLALFFLSVLLNYFFEKLHYILLVSLNFFLIFLYIFLLKDFTFIFFQAFFIYPSICCIKWGDHAVRRLFNLYSNNRRLSDIHSFCLFFSLLCLSSNAALAAEAFLHQNFTILYDSLLILVAWVVFLIGGFLKRKFNTDPILSLFFMSIACYPFCFGCSWIYFELILIIPVSYFIGKSYY
jgi:hypothetical protein